MPSTAPRKGLRVAEPVRSASEQVVVQLRQSILLGDLASGEKLPTEQELCGIFGVGRSTIREAVRVLLSQKLLRIQRGAGGGTFVANAEVDSVSDQLEMGIGMLSVARHVGLSDLLQAREMMEVPTAGIAAVNRTDEDLRRISSALKEEETTPGAVLGGRRIVHASILDAAHNTLLTLMVRPIFAVLETRYLDDRGEFDLWNRVNEEHTRIYDAIRDQDKTAAENFMRAHLDTLAVLYREIEVHAHQKWPPPW